MNAKKVRDDVKKVKGLLKRGPKVIVSLAPSFVTEFPNLSDGQITAALKSLGFAHVSETALGAQEGLKKCGGIYRKIRTKEFIFLQPVHRLLR